MTTNNYLVQLQCQSKQFRLSVALLAHTLTGVNSVPSEPGGPRSIDIGFLCPLKKEFVLATEFPIFGQPYAELDVIEACHP